MQPARARPSLGVGRGPFTTRRGVGAVRPRRPSRCLRELEREELLVRGELRPGGTEREWCDPDVLRRLRRASLAALRKEVEPAEQRGATPASSPPGTASIAARRCARRSCRCRRSPLPGRALGDRGAAAARARTTGPSSSTSSARRGELVWVGAGLDRVAVYFREDAAVLGPRRRRAAPEGRRARRDPRALCPLGARSGSTCSPRPGSRRERGLPALWDLVWAGEVDERRLAAAARGAPLRRAEARAAAAALLAPPRDGADRDAGPLVARPTGSSREPSATRARRAPARAAGHRHPRRRPRRGHPRRLRRRLRRAARARDARPLPARLLRRGPRRRAVRARRRRRAAARAAAAGGRRAGARSCSPPPIRRSRTARRCPWPKRAGGRAARVAGAHVVLLGGEAALFVERGGRTLVPLRDPDESWLRPALAALVEHARAAAAQAARGRALRRRAGGRDSAMLPLLVEAGFLAGPRRASCDRRQSWRDGAGRRHPASRGPGALRARRRADRSRGAPSARTRHGRCPATRRAPARAR